MQLFLSKFWNGARDFHVALYTCAPEFDFMKEVFVIMMFRRLAASPTSDRCC